MASGLDAWLTIVDKLYTAVFQRGPTLFNSPLTISFTSNDTTEVTDDNGGDSGLVAVTYPAIYGTVGAGGSGAVYGEAVYGP